MSLKEPTHLEWDDRLAESDKKLVSRLNASLDRLSGLRAVEINVSGKFLRSKIAWKLATYQHALLHRLVALMDGASVAWNNRCTLSAMLSARANGDVRVDGRVRAAGYAASERGELTRA